MENLRVQRVPSAGDFAAFMRTRAGEIVLPILQLLKSDKILREMEEQGRVRRGHFVDGLSGAQFAHAGAVDRLRAARADEHERDERLSVEDIEILAAADPANPYGALLSWPDTAVPGQGGPRRVPGAWVMLARGRPVFYVGSRARSLLSFPSTVRDVDGALDAAIEALRHLPRGRGLLVIDRIDGVPAPDSALLPRFKAADFALDYRGIIDVRPHVAVPSG